MEQDSHSRLHYYYAGSLIITALLIGGGTEQGLWSDHLIQILLLPALFMGLSSKRKSQLSNAAKIVVVLILALLALQFLPLSRPLPEIIDQDAQHHSLMLTRSISGSIESVLFAFTALGFFLYLTRFPGEMLERLLSFLVAGFFANFVVMLVQLSYDSRVPIDDLLPFVIRAGLFANENHASTLIYVVIPILAFLFLVRYLKPAIYAIFVTIIVGVLFAQGSRAGMGISAAMGLLCFIIFFPRGTKPAWRLLQIIGVAIVGIFILALPLLPGLLGEDLRVVIQPTTLKAAIDHLPLGSGLGTFVNIYPEYQAADAIVDAYVNHAHNDYLELLLEGGLLAVALIIAYCVLIFQNMFQSHLSNAAGISIMAILLHSTVDYPLRTFAITIAFALFSAIILSSSEATQRAPRANGSNGT